MSTNSLKKSPPQIRSDAAVEIKQLLKEREEKIREIHSKIYVDTPRAITYATEMGDRGMLWPVVIVAMESGRVWKSVNGEQWQSASWQPLPDTSSRELYDEVAAMGRELKRLGHVEEE